MDKLILKIITPERVILEKKTEWVTLPTRDNGEITILPDHVPYLTILEPGLIEGKTKQENVSIAISGGFLEFHNNQVTILADTAERAEDIDLARAEKARKKAEEIMKEKRKSLDEKQYAIMLSQLKKQTVRIKLAKRR